MADSPAPAESSAQQQARLRRERRAAKIAAGGADRLKAISSLQGGTHRDVDKDVPVRPIPAPAATDATPDPDITDISQHYYNPSPEQPRQPSSAFGFGSAFNGSLTDSPSFPAPISGQSHDPSQDPMMAMLQQMMGGGAGGPGMPGQAGQPGDFPPGLANMFSAMQGGAAEPSPDQSSAWIWRLVHSVFSLGLAIYIVLQTPFTGSKISRALPRDEDWSTESSPSETFQHFFYLFATFEVVLQSSRYFVERGQLQGSGILSSIGSMLPEPYAGYIRVIGRYSVIYSTVVSDAMVVVFVLGAASWWRGGIIS